MKKKLTTEQLADAKRLKRIFVSRQKQLGISSQDAFADELGMTQSAVSHYLNGVNALNLERAADFANKLGVRIADFSPSLDQQARKLLKVIYGDDPTLAAHQHPQKQYPLLNWANAGNWCEEPAPLYLGNDIEQWYETSIECSPHAFWLEVKGDSMASSNELNIQQGMIILIDPDVKPTANNLVIAKLEGEKELTFKQLITEGYDAYLKPLNPQYNMIPLNEKVHIVGVVVEAKIAKLP